MVRLLNTCLKNFVENDNREPICRVEWQMGDGWSRDVQREIEDRSPPVFWITTTAAR
jgi:hypothetical protein